MCWFSSHSRRLSLWFFSSRASSTSPHFSTICFRPTANYSPDSSFNFLTNTPWFKWSNSVLKKKGLNMAFMCSFLSLTIYRCLIKITESEFSRRKTEEKIEKLLLFFFLLFFTKTWKRKFWHWITMSRLFVSYSVAVMYKLSWYVIPLCEPNTGLIDLKTCCIFVLQ